MYRKVNKDLIYQIETNIDDMDPRLYGGLMERLFGEGGLDVFFIPVQAKQNRPGILITVLCKKDKLERLIDVLFKETTTFGIRFWPVERRILNRRFKMVSTPYGKLRVKVGSYKGKVYTVTPEYKTCRDIALKKKVPLKDILQHRNLIPLKNPIPCAKMSFRRKPESRLLNEELDSA